MAKNHLNHSSSLSLNPTDRLLAYHVSLRPGRYIVKSNSEYLEPIHIKKPDQPDVLNLCNIMREKNPKPQTQNPRTVFHHIEIRKSSLNCQFFSNNLTFQDLIF